MDKVRYVENFLCNKHFPSEMYCLERKVNYVILLLFFFTVTHPDDKQLTGSRFILRYNLKLCYARELQEEAPCF